MMLKSCPSCGKRVPVELFAEHDLKGREVKEFDGFFVVCNARRGGCGHCSGWGETPEEAVASWNRRCTDDGLERHVAASKQILQCQVEMTRRSMQEQAEQERARQMAEQEIHAAAITAVESLLTSVTLDAKAILVELGRREPELLVKLCEDYREKMGSRS